MAHGFTARPAIRSLDGSACLSSSEQCANSFFVVRDPLGVLLNLDARQGGNTTDKHIIDEAKIHLPGRFEVVHCQRKQEETQERVTPG